MGELQATSRQLHLHIWEDRQIVDELLRIISVTLRSNVKIEPAPLGKYLYKPHVMARCGSDGTDELSTCGLCRGTAISRALLHGASNSEKVSRFPEVAECVKCRKRCTTVPKQYSSQIYRKWQDQQLHRSLVRDMMDLAQQSMGITRCTPVTLHHLRLIHWHEPWPIKELSSWVDNHVCTVLKWLDWHVGVNVESTISGSPCLCAISAILSISVTLSLDFQLLIYRALRS